jgi:hypothetical protein
MTLQTVDLLTRVAFVPDESARLQCIDELLGFQLGTSEYEDNGCPKVTLTAHVSRGRRIPELCVQLASKLFQVNVFRNHLESLTTFAPFKQSLRMGRR